MSKQLGCSLFSPCCVRKGHAAFAMLGWVPIFKIFSGLLRNLPLAPSVIGRHLTTSLFFLPCNQMVPMLSTKKGTLTVHCRPLCSAGPSVSEASSAFFPGQKQDVGCARRHLWVCCIPFSLCCFTGHLLSSHESAVVCGPSVGRVRSREYNL